MGAADVVPGVSGGTIAFITGIYEELLNSIKSINLDALKALKNDGIKGFWTHINGNFLVALFSGILIAVAGLAKVVTYLLEHYPVLLWGFFFGLILGSAIVVARQIPKWSAGTLIGLFLGAVSAYLITKLSPAQTPEELWFVFIAGMIAICAMILPGISGSFLLLMMGKYHYILSSIKEFDFKVIAVFGAGCVVGLLGFSRLLTWLFKKWKDVTIAILTGFMLGSLNKVWPWKITTEFMAKHDGDPKEEWVAAVQRNVMPGDYVVTELEKLHGVLEKSAFTPVVILLMVLGFALVIGLEVFSAKQKMARMEAQETTPSEEA